MSIFELKKNKKPSLIGRILKKTPKENALIEINNLFAKNEKDLTKVTLEQIEKITEKYNLKLNKKFKFLRLELFKKYINHCLKDQKIDEDEIKTFLHLKKLLHLTDTEIKKILSFETKKIYNSEVKKAVEDGILTTEEKNNLEKLKKNLLINDNLAQEILKQNSERILSDFINDAISDERLSDDEYEKMNVIARSLGIEPKIGKNTKAKLDKYRLYWLIENGKLPKLNSPINLQKNEVLHFSTNVKWLENRKITKRINYGGPTARIKIAKGVYYRMGSISAKTISEDVLQEIDRGTIYLTNKRLIFMGNRGNKTIRINKVLGLKPYKNGVDIQKDTGKSPFLKFNRNIDIFTMMFIQLMEEE